MAIKVNRQALHDFQIEDNYICGMVLEGWEVKSLKSGNFDFAGSFAYLAPDAVWLKGFNISNYRNAPQFSDQHRLRDRKLLLSKNEILKIRSEIKRNRRQTLIPLEVIEVRGLLKMKLGLAIAKKTYQKKDSIKRKDQMRDIQRDLKSIK